MNGCRQLFASLYRCNRTLERFNNQSPVDVVVVDDAFFFHFVCNGRSQSLFHKLIGYCVMFKYHLLDRTNNKSASERRILKENCFLSVTLKLPEHKVISTAKAGSQHTLQQKYEKRYIRAKRILQQNSHMLFLSHTHTYSSIASVNTLNVAFNTFINKFTDCQFHNAKSKTIVQPADNRFFRSSFHVFSNENNTNVHGDK